MVNDNDFTVSQPSLVPDQFIASVAMGMTDTSEGTCSVCGDGNIHTRGICNHKICPHCFVHLGIVGRSRCPCCRADLGGLYVSGILIDIYIFVIECLLI